MKTIEGNLITFALNGEFEVIVHGSNCFNTMGAGIAAQIKECFPEAYEIDQRTKVGAPYKLGDLTYHHYKSTNLVVVNGYTQYNPGANCDYAAIRKVFKKVKKNWSGKKIAYPKIGAGIAGGDWNVISKIIDEELEGEDHTLVIYK